MHCSNVNLNRAAARAAVVAAVASACLLFGSSSALAARVSCGQTIVTSTKLANDLIDCPSNGIVIGANNVTLDLNGHVVDGDAADSSRARPTSHAISACSRPATAASRSERHGAPVHVRGDG